MRSLIASSSIDTLAASSVKLGSDSSWPAAAKYLHEDSPSLQGNVQDHSQAGFKDYFMPRRGGIVYYSLIIKPCYMNTRLYLNKLRVLVRREC